MYKLTQNKTRMKKITSLYLILLMAVAVSMQTCQVEDNTFTCYLRTLQTTVMDSSISETDRNGISTAKILHVRCSDVFFFESQLKTQESEAIQ